MSNGDKFLCALLVLTITACVFVYVNDTPAPQLCNQDIKYHIAVLEKLPTESTGAFFDRAQETIDCLSERYAVYAFLPIFDVQTPTVVGATITYEVKE